MSLSNLTFFELPDDPTAEITLDLPENLISSINHIAEVCEVSSDEIVENALCFWLLQGKVETIDELEEE